VLIIMEKEETQTGSSQATRYVSTEEETLNCISLHKTFRRSHTAVPSLRRKVANAEKFALLCYNLEKEDPVCATCVDALSDEVAVVGSTA
jgi:ribosomal protein S2